MISPNADKFYRQVLPNGLTLIFEKRNQPVVSIFATTKFGSGHETVKLKGLAHFIEHAVFKATKSRTAEQISSSVEKIGGELNAFTAEEFTSFYVKVRSKHFDLGMDILGDIMMNPLFAKKDLDMERKAIIEEIKMYHDNPRYYTIFKLRELLFSQPFGMNPLGTEAIIKKLTKLSLTKYHAINYNPSNIVISIVGDTNVDKIWNLGKHDFFKKTVQKQIQFSEVKPSFGKFDKIIEKRKSIDQAHISLGLGMPSRSSKDRYAAEIFNTILGVGMSCRLFQEIREKRGLAYDIHSSVDQGKNFGYLQVYAGTEKKKINEAKELILKEIENMKNLDQKDFEQAKEELIGQHQLDDEKSESVARKLLVEELNGNAKEYYNFEDRISEVKLEDVRKLAEVKDYAFAGLIPEK
jgi:predicted Zn-dependent peptidase